MRSKAADKPLQEASALKCTFPPANSHLCYLRQKSPTLAAFNPSAFSHAPPKRRPSHGSAVGAPSRRAAYGFAVCGRRRLSPPPHAAPPSRGRGGAPRSSYLAVSPSISNVIRVFSPTRTTLFSVDSSTVKLSLSQKKCDISGVLKISAPFSCERR